MMIARGLDLLAANAGPALVTGVALGIAVPGLAAALQPFLTVSVFILLFLALLRIDWSRLSQAFGRPIPLLAGTLWVLIGAPTIVLVAAHALGLESAVTVAIVLAASAPPLMASPAFALLLGLDAALCVSLLLLATLGAPFTVALVSAEFLSLGQSVSSLDLMSSLVSVIAGAAGAAVLAQQVFGKARIAASPTLISGLSVIALVALSIGAMDGTLERFRADPRTVLMLLFAAVALNVGLQALTALVFAAVGRLRALTMAFCGGNRNVLLLLAIMPAHTHPDVALFFALAQIPTYLLPILLRPLYRRLMEGSGIQSFGQEEIGIAREAAVRGTEIGAAPVTTLGTAIAVRPSSKALSTSPESC